MLFVDVCINLPVKTLADIYTYQLPEHLADADVGWRVMVSFANSKTEGFILKKYHGQPDIQSLKPVEKLLGHEAWFDNKMLALAAWLSDYYLCAPAEALRLFLPGKKSLSSVNLYKLNGDNPPAQIHDKTEESIIRALSDKGALSAAKLRRICGAEISRPLTVLINSGHVRVEREYQSKFKKRLIICIKATPDAAGYLKNTPKCPHARKTALTLLMEQPSMTLDVLKQNGVTRDTLLRMQKLGLVEFFQEESMRNSYAAMFTRKAENELTEEQQAAVDNIAASLGRHDVFLLQGVTGSGKTEVYLTAAQKAIRQKKQVLLLVPEIALTGQIIRRFKERFPDSVVVAHSRLSINERMDVFEYIKTGEPCILIGARSALFAPFRALGLVIMDEEHEFSYKQEERPSYHARAVARKLADLASAPLLLGSATPDLESYYRACCGQYKLLKLSKRPFSSLLPEVIVVDMKDELQSGNKGVLSYKLLASLKNIEQSGAQAIILLNRRGFATFVLCRDCGYAVRCRHCAVSLVYHEKDSIMRCHYCGYTEHVPAECPSCKSRRIRFFGTGTQKAEAQLKEWFPELAVIRMDQDTTGEKFAHDEILTEFKQGKYKLLLGTQMVAKGHDVPNVTLVGILSADSALNIPDFRAAERTFSLLTQAAGRAGRGEKPGHVILQAYETRHPAIQYAVIQDFDAFAAHELKDRRELFYPPFSSIIKITFSDRDESAALTKATEFIDSLNRSGIDKTGRLEINGPFQAMVAKIKDTYKVIILLKTDRAETIKQWLKSSGYPVKKDMSIDIDPLNVI